MLFVTALSACTSPTDRVEQGIDQAPIGRAGVNQLDVDRVTLHINDVLIAERGCRAVSYTEEQGAAAMAGTDIEIAIALDRGTAEATVYTSDLSYDYVRINAEYRT